MEYVALGRTGIRVSQLCFGTMSFGGDADREESRRMFAACRDAGINFFDCADVYNGGQAEEILGELAAEERDSLVITSKCVQEAGPDPNDRGASRRHIVMSVEASLKRLRTDRLDVLFMHRWDEATDPEQTLRALDDLVTSGKVLYVGASNYAAWQVARALGISERRGWVRFDVLQPMYNLVKRQAEAEILPLAEAEEIAVISYSPVGGGLLSGKYRPQSGPESGRIIDNQMYAKRYAEPWMVETAAAFTERADRLGVHPVSLAVAWVAAHPAITCPIIGARTVEQLRPSLESISVDMTPDLRAELAALSRTPPPATDRLEEQG